MKETNLTRSHSRSVALGLVAPSAARSYSWVEELDNDSGVNITEGQVVAVKSDGSIELSSIANDPRPTGVALDDIDTGETGQVCFGGPVDTVSVVSSVTAGQYGQTSTTAGAAQVTAHFARAFCVFTSSGTTPSAFLWGGRGGGGEGIIGTETSEPVYDHGNMGATETVDLANGTWHRGTLNASCTITIQGFTAAEGLVVVFEVAQNGTGGWSITWDPDVTFIGDAQPSTTASATTIFLLFSSAGDSTIYGAKVGGGVSSADVSALISASGVHQHTIGDAFTADGLSTTYYLSNWPDDDTVAVYVAGLRTDVTQSGDAITFSGVPPVNAAIRADYILELT